jgi:hypothetical protein
MMSVDEGRGTIDSAHPSAKGITWYRILDGFVSPGAPAEKARGDGQVFSARERPVCGRDFPAEVLRLWGHCCFSARPEHLCAYRVLHLPISEELCQRS